jgi:hypothetical protein
METAPGDHCQYQLHVAGGKQEDILLNIELHVRGLRVLRVVARVKKHDMSGC